MSFQLKGKIKVVNEVVEVSEKFKKREFIVTDSDAMYPQDISFQLAQDNCSKIDGMSEGDEVEVSFNLRGREWTSPTGEVKYFNTLDAWRIEKAQGIAGQYKQGSIEKRFEEDAIQSEADQLEDDLPF